MQTEFFFTPMHAVSSSFSDNMNYKFLVMFLFMSCASHMFYEESLE